VLGLHYSSREVGILQHSEGMNVDYRESIRGNIP